MSVAANYEKNLLGSMLFDNGCIDAVKTIVCKDFFAVETYKELFEQICTGYAEDGHIDILTLTQRCPRINAGVIASLTDEIVSAKTAELYARNIRNQYQARMVKEIFSSNAQEISPLNVTNIIDNVTRDLLNIAGSASMSEAVSAAKLVDTFLATVQKGIVEKPEYLGIKTGFTDLDDMLDGIPTKQLTIIGARPSIGKTAFATNLMTGIATYGTPCAMFSLEMTNEQIAKRMFSSETGLSGYLLTHGMIGQGMNMYNKINTAAEKFASLPLLFLDNNQCTRDLPTIVAKIRSLAKTGTKVFFIDHIGLIQHNNQSLKRYEQIGDITFTFKNLSKDLDISIIALCQVRRDVEGKEPGLNDLRESGDIEQNADICMFLHRARATGNETIIPTKLIVSKDRDGSCGTVELDFLPKLVKFVPGQKKTNDGAA